MKLPQEFDLLLDLMVDRALEQIGMNASSREASPTSGIVLVRDSAGLARELEGSATPALVVLQIPREEVESRRYGPLLESLHTLTDSREMMRRGQGAVALSVSGYDEDPRELAQIPEARAYFQAITEQWPHWLWFLSREVGLLPLIACLCDVEIEHLGDGTALTRFRCAEELSRTLQNLLDREVELHMLYGTSEEEFSESVTSALRACGLDLSGL